MTPTTSQLPPSDLTAGDVTWDLEPLVDGRGAEGVDALLDDAEGRARALASYRGRIGEVDADALADLLRALATLAALGGRSGEADADALSDLMHELATIGELAGRAGSYAGLRFADDRARPATGPLM